MSEPEPIAAILPDVAEGIRSRMEAWSALTPEEQAEQEAEWAEQDRLKREAELTKWRTWTAEIPPRFQGASVFHRGAKEWIDAVLANKHHTGLLIAGPTGVGKTHLLYGMQCELAERQGPRMEVVKLVKILAGMRPGGETTQETIDKLCQIPILAIDDIGAHKPSEWVNERLYEIIDTRYDNMLPIVATTNRKNVDAVLDDRLASRLEECCEMVFLTGTDRRRQA
jgi:DNA replication protein DnaC